MRARAELFWRLLPDVRAGERTRFLFFAGLFTLINVAQTVGLAGSEALLLGELGARALPLTFIFASLATVLGSILYAVWVGRLRNDDLFAWLLALSALLLGCLAWLAQSGLAAALVALVCLFYLTQAIFLNHFWTFSGDYFDTLASKRLVPLFTVGASLGGLLGGAFTIVAARSLPSVALIAAWGALLAAAALMLRLARRPLRRWGPLELEEADETSVASLRGAVRHLGSSALAGWMLVASLGMVLALFLAQYLYSDIFARSFDTPEALATFFGVYLTVSNVAEIPFEIWVTPLLIRRLGVPAANLVHPVLMLAAFGGLNFRFGLGAAVAARVCREPLDNALSTPVRSLLYNAMPIRLRGQMRAFLEGILFYAGMSLAGVVLLVLERPDPRWLCAAGSAAAIVYLVANVGARRAYLGSLVTQLRAGRLDLADVHGAIGSWEASRLAVLWEQLLADEGSRPSRSLLQLVPELAARGIVSPLVRAASHPNPDVRRTCLNALVTTGRDNALGPVALALDDPDAAVRLAALRGLVRLRADPEFLAGRMRDLLEDPDPQVRAEAALQAGEKGLALLAEMIRERAPEVAAAALRVAWEPLLPAVLERALDSDATIRAAALECLARIAPAPPLECAEVLDELASPDPRVRRAAVLLLANLQEEEKAQAGLSSALADQAPEVQFTAESVLSSLGDAAIDTVLPQLRSERERAVEAALRVVSASGVQRARELLTDELRHRACRLWYHRMGLQLLPQDDSPGARFLRAAHEDAVRRNRRFAFRILALIENPGVIGRVEKALQFGGGRARADALEVLSNLGDRESARLLVVMHEEGPLEERYRSVAGLLEVPGTPEQLAQASLRDEVGWIRLGARAIGGPPGVAPEEGERMERLLALKQVPLFATLSLDQLDAVLQITREASYLSGEVIVREGDPGGELYLLLEGRVQAWKNHGTPRASCLNTISAISYFGEMAILDDEPRSASVVALDRARLLSLDGRSLKELIHQMPEIAFEIFRELTKRVRSAEKRLGDR
jgi:HEAT repeat protein